VVGLNIGAERGQCESGLVHAGPRAGEGGGTNTSAFLRLRENDGHQVWIRGWTGRVGDHKTDYTLYLV
jgi:hypothetical protein